MKHPKLIAEPRTVLGKKVKKLRREGILPANVYGKDLASVSIQVSMEEFTNLYKEVGETGLVDLEFDGKNHPILVKNVNFEFRYHTPLHADFYQVNLKEKVKAMVPLEFIGEPLAVSEKLGNLIQPISEVEVEALPEELPEHIEVNLEPLAAVDEQILVSELKAAEGVTILTDPDQVVAKIAEIVEEPEPEVEAPEGAEEATPEGETVEGEAGAETTDQASSEEKSE